MEGEIGRGKTVRTSPYCFGSPTTNISLAASPFTLSHFIRFYGFNHFREGSAMKEQCDFLNTQTPVIPRRSQSGF